MFLDSVVMDNLPAHKVAGVRQAIKAAGAELRRRIGKRLDRFTPQECSNYFAAAGDA